MGKKDKKLKFSYSTEYQADLLRYTVTDRFGYKALQLYEDSYFDLLEHSTIAYTLKRFYNKRRTIPGYSVLKEELLRVMSSREMVESLTAEDRDNILKLGKDLYAYPVKDGKAILEYCAQFVSYAQFSSAIEGVDVYNFDSYKDCARDIAKAIKTGDVQEETKGTYLIGDIVNRQFERQSSNYIIPTPFRQINKITNAGGYGKPSIIVVLDKPKQLKTAIMVNVARGYLKLKKKVLVIDFENGQEEWATRLEQSIARINKKENLAGDHDKKVQKILRKYKRLGGEIYIKRLPAGSNTNHLQILVDELKEETGFVAQELIIDYVGLMGSLSNKDDDHNRIADAYMDVLNFAFHNGIEHVWTPHHVPKDAYKREDSRYKEGDFAKCTEIGRHVHAIFGLNRNQDERDNKVVRMELVMQRDGPQEGRALFRADVPCQRVDEFTISERVEYDHEMGQISLEETDYKAIKRTTKKNDIGNRE